MAATNGEPTRQYGAIGTALRTFVSWGLKKKFNLELVRLPSNGRYSDIHLPRVYAPWNLTPDFVKTYQAIRNNTLVNIYRCWELWQLVEQTAKLQPGAILEVGVWRGGSGALMAKKALIGGSTDPVYLCDTFEGVVKAGSNDSVYKGGEHADTSQDIVENLFHAMGISSARILKGVFPEQTAHLIEPEVRFRLCHIDVDVYQSTREVTEWVWDRMVPGGVVVYDDYGDQTCDGVTRYIEELASMGDRLVFCNVNAHAIVVKL